MRMPLLVRRNGTESGCVTGVWVKVDADSDAVCRVAREDSLEAI